jgi:hypothetical protein
MCHHSFGHRFSCFLFHYISSGTWSANESVYSALCMLPARCPLVSSSLEYTRGFFRSFWNTFFSLKRLKTFFNVSSRCSAVFRTATAAGGALAQRVYGARHNKFRKRLRMAWLCDSQLQFAVAFEVARVTDSVQEWICRSVQQRCMIVRWSDLIGGTGIDTQSFDSIFLSSNFMI